ncbi:MAG: hypothetical protein ACR2PT_14955 [Endozoicomonas sp.]
MEPENTPASGQTDLLKNSDSLPVLLILSMIMAEQFAMKTIINRLISSLFLLSFPLATCAEWSCPDPYDVELPFKGTKDGNWLAEIKKLPPELPSYFNEIKFEIVDGDYPREYLFGEKDSHFQLDIVEPIYRISGSRMKYLCNYDREDNEEFFRAVLDFSGRTLPESDSLPLPVWSRLVDGRRTFDVPQISLRYQYKSAGGAVEGEKSPALHLQGLWNEASTSMDVPALSKAGAQFIKYEDKPVIATETAGLLVDIDGSKQDVFKLMKDRSWLTKEETGQCVKVGKGVSKCGCNSNNIQDSVNSGAYTVFDVVYDTRDGSEKLGCTLFKVHEENDQGREKKKNLKYIGGAYQRWSRKNEEL